MALGTKTQLAKIAIYSTLLTALTIAVKLFHLTVYHHTSDPNPNNWFFFFLLFSSPLLLLLRKPRNHTFIKLLSTGSGIAAYYALRYHMSLEGVGSVDVSLAFLGTMAVYLFVLFLVMFPKERNSVRLPLVPIMVSSDTDDSGRILSVIPTWIAVAVVVLVAWYLLDSAHQLIADDDDDAKKENQQQLLARYGDESTESK